MSLYSHSDCNCKNVVRNTREALYGCVTGSCCSITDIHVHLFLDSIHACNRWSITSPQYIRDTAMRCDATTQGDVRRHGSRNSTTIFRRLWKRKKKLARSQIWKPIRGRWYRITRARGGMLRQLRLRCARMRFSRIWKWCSDRSRHRTQENIHSLVVNRRDWMYFNLMRSVIRRPYKQHSLLGMYLGEYVRLRKPIISMWNEWIPEESVWLVQLVKAPTPAAVFTHAVP